MNLKERTKWTIEYIVKRERLSNYKIGKILGVKPDTVKSYRSKLANPKIDFMIKLCDQFGIDLLWFAKGEGEPFAGAMFRFPEVCTSSRYEIGGSEDNSTLSSSGASLLSSVASGDDKSSTYIAINSTEKSFVSLCKMAGIPIARGWKTKLSRHIGVTPAQLSNSISKDRISKSLLSKIDEKGYAVNQWLHRTDTTPDHSGQTQHIAAELSLQRLALLEGIKIDGDWTSKLADSLGVTPWAVGLSVLKNSIEGGLLQIIDGKYKREAWAVKRPLKQDPPVGDLGTHNNEELIKIAWEILCSDSMHAMSLSMNILSLQKALLAEKEPAVDDKSPGGEHIAITLPQD